MPIVNCLKCNSEFYVKPSHQKAGYGKYCSMLCTHEGQKKGTYVKCHLCQTLSWKTPKDIRRSKSGKLFCTKSCSMAWKNSTALSGINHPLWKGGHSMYRERLEESKRKIICRQCGITDKRVLVAHHIDKIVTIIVWKI